MKNRIILEWNMNQSPAAAELREGLYDKVNNCVRAALANADDAHCPEAVYIYTEHEAVTIVSSQPEPAFLKP